MVPSDPRSSHERHTDDDPGWQNEPAEMDTSKVYCSGEGRRERMERIKRQDRRQRNNEKRNKKGKSG